MSYSDAHKKMLRVGLTGGIGCGKSAVAAMMRELGCHVLDADKMARDLVEPGRPAYAGVVAEFGRDILNPDGRINREALAKIVFADPARLARLNAIIHPFVEQELDRQFARLEQEDPRGIAVVEAALLVESGYYQRLDRLIVVWCRPEQQIERLTDPAGRAMSREQAERRIASQAPQQEKRKLADDEIDCSTTIDSTLQQVTLLVERLKYQAAS
jgi:dephospho-CoA kinase